MASVTMDEVQRLVRTQLGVRSVSASDRLAEDLGAESADVANIVAAAEERFDTEIPEQDIARILTVADLYAVIASRGKQA